MTRRAKKSRPGKAGIRPAQEKTRDVYVVRPFEGLATEADWVALRELVPAATAPLRLAASLLDSAAGREVTLATVLPMAVPALVKPDGRILLGLQTTAQSGDLSRDIAAALVAALHREPGASVPVTPAPGPGPRLQDLLADGSLEVSVQPSFEFWFDPDGAADPTAKAALERANASLFPTVKLASAPAAYWCQFPEKAHLRWVLSQDEDIALAGLSRLAAARELTLGESTRFAGMFRTHGLLVPVWDLPRTAPASDWEKPLAAFAARYAEAVAATGELDSLERRARHGLLGRLLNLR